MSKNQKIAIAIVIIGLIAYYFYNKNNTVVTPTPSTGTGSASGSADTVVTPAPVNGTLPVAPPVTIAPPGNTFVAMPSSAATAPNTTYQDAVVSPGTSQSVATPLTPNGIDATVYNAVQNWAKSDGRAPVLAMAAAADPTEYAGVYNLLVNYWPYLGKAKPASVVTFWNNLRTKYDPTHKSW